MKNKYIFLIFVVALLVVAVAACWYIASKKSADESANTNSSAPTLSISFICEDGSYFVATFPNTNMNTLQTYFNGNLTGTLPKVASTTAPLGQRYENSEWNYLFQGETVKRGHKVTTNVTTCRQPMDPNNAPVNFGD